MTVFIANADTWHRLHTRLFVPLIGIVIAGTLIGTGNGAAPIFPFTVLMAVGIALSIIGERGRLSRFYPGAMGLALLLLSGVELVVYLRSSYRPNSFVALEENVFLLLLFFFVRTGLTDAALRRRLFIAMSLLAAFWGGAWVIRCWRSYEQLQALGITDLTAFKQYFAYGAWPAQALLLLPWPLTLFAARREARRWRAGAALVVLLLLALFLYSFSRGAYIALAAFALMIVTGCTVLKILPRRRLFAKVAIAGVALVLAALPVCNSVRTTAAMTATTSQSRSLSSRGQLYRLALANAAQAPPFGIGTYNYPLLAQRSAAPAKRPEPYYDVPDKASDAEVAAGKISDALTEFSTTPLNRFIVIALEKGWAGLLVTLAVTLLFFGLAGWRLRQAHGMATSQRVESLFFAAAFGAALLYQMSYYPAHGWESVMALEWMLYAVVATPMITVLEAT